MNDKKNGALVLEDKIETLMHSVEDNNKIYNIYKENMLCLQYPAI